jgi:hypothetical protein
MLKYHSDNDRALIDSSKPIPLGFTPNMALEHLLKSRIIFIGLKFYPFMTTQVLIKKVYYSSRVVVTLPPLDFYRQLSMTKQL